MFENPCRQSAVDMDMDQGTGTYCVSCYAAVEVGTTLAAPSTLSVVEDRLITVVCLGQPAGL